MSHYDRLIDAFGREWEIHERPDALPAGCYIEHDTARFWYIYDVRGNEVIHWECRRFPGCDTLVITTKVELRDDLRGRGLGRFFRELRHRAYRRAGFVGELATVRSDNERQNALMGSMGGVPMGEFRSDFGGTFKLWLTNLVQTTTPRNVHPQNLVYTGIMGDQVQVRPLQTQPRVGVQARTHDQDLSRYILQTATPADLDAIAQLPTVQPLPGDGVGLLRTESDASLRARIQAACEEASAADGFVLPCDAEIELRRRERERQNSSGGAGTGYTVGRHPKRQLHRGGI